MGKVSGPDSALSLFLLSALVVPGILDMLDAVVTGVDCCPCSVALVPPVLGLLICHEIGRLVGGSAIAPRRGRLCGRRLALGRVLVEGLGSGSGFMRLGWTGVLSDGNPVPAFLTTDGRGDRLVEREGWMPGCRVAGEK